MNLYLKCGPESKTVGDCPFAHQIRMVLHIKGLAVNLHPCKQEEKPDWLLNEFEGKMPCLDDDGERKIESSVIAEYLDMKYPNPPLLLGFDESRSVDAIKATENLFPSLIKFLKCPEFDFYSEKAFLAASNDLDSYLKQHPEDKYLLGDKMSMIDCSVTPKLFIQDVGVKHYYPETHKKLAQLKNLQRYMKEMFNSEAFKSTKYPESTMIWGWEKARQASSSQACGV